jgi:hypothetical protein
MGQVRKVGKGREDEDRMGSKSERHGTKGAVEGFLPALCSFNRSRGLVEYPM